MKIIVWMDEQDTFEDAETVANKIRGHFPSDEVEVRVRFEEG